MMMELNLFLSGMILGQIMTSNAHVSTFLDVIVHLGQLHWVADLNRPLSQE